ncbi:MAG: hypothetical protein ACLSUW_10020, partial [Akkermansia sp.]
VKQAVEAVKQQNKANALWEKAAAASGANAAALYGEGLQQLPPYAARERKDILEKIRKADPEDTRGMHFKYTFNHLPYIEKIKRMVNDSAKDGGQKDYKAAHAYVDKQLKIPGMTPLQKQQVMAARFWLYRNEGKKDLALKTLTDIARISPKTLMGVGAQSYYRYLTEPVTLKEPRITGYYLRPEMTPTRVNIAGMLNGPGNYKITFKMNSGGCSIRNPRFMKGNRVVSELPKDRQDKNGRDSPAPLRFRKAGLGFRLPGPGMVRCGLRHHRDQGILTPAGKRTKPPFTTFTKAGHSQGFPPFFRWEKNFQPAPKRKHPSLPASCRPKPNNIPGSFKGAIRETFFSFPRFQGRITPSSRLPGVLPPFCGGIPSVR